MLDTTIIAGSAGHILGKIGAEGLHADCIMSDGIGIAVKVLDGNSRALPPTVAHIIGRFTTSDRGWLDELRTSAVYNAAGAIVGEISVAVDD